MQKYKYFLIYNSFTLFVFYSTEIGENEGNLLEEELHHCANVLRKKEGDIIFVTNGNGLLVEGKIKNIKKSNLIFEVISSKFQEENPIKNCIALSPPKSSDRLEWFVEKVIEIGIRSIYLFDVIRTERHRVNEKRLEKIAISAMKQSKQYYLPEIKLFNKYEELLANSTVFQNKLIAFCEISEPYIGHHISNESNIILIGPEGDFTIEEVILAKNIGFTPVSLGKNILRTETAGVLSATLFETNRYK